MAISHVYSQTVADGTATSVVRPSDWNSAHNQYMTIGSNTAGVSTLSGTNIQFNGGNNMTLSANGNTLIFSAANQTADTNKAGIGFSSTTTAGTAIVGTNNTNGLSLGVPAFLTTYAAQSNQTGNLYVSGNTTQLSSTAGLDLRSISFEGAGVASVGVSNGRVLISVPSGGGAGDGVNIIRAGTTGTTGTTFSASTGTININGGNNITVSQDGSNNIVISAAQGGIAAGTQTATSGTLVFANSNGVTFGMSGSSQITASVAAAGGAQTGISSVAVSNATYTSGQISFRDGNNISFASGTGQAVSITHNLQSAGAYLTTARASNDAIGLNTALTANGLSVTANSSGLSINVPAWLTTAAQSNHSHNFATTTTNGSLMVVATTNSAGATVAVPPYITTYAAQSNQTGNLYVTANSTQLSSTAGVDLRSLSFAGAGVASVGVSGGVVVVSVPSGGGAGDGVNIIRAGTTGTTGTTYSASTGTININGGNNITVSQDGSNNIVISAAQGGIAAGSQTATSGTLVFANSNNITFGMSGSSQITASFNAGGGAAATLSNWQNFHGLWTEAAVVPAAIRQSTSVAFAAMLDNNLSMDRMRMLRSCAQGTTQVATVANTSWGFTQNETHHFVFYTRGTGASSASLQSYTSTSVGLSMSVQGSIGAASNNLSIRHSYNVPNATGTSQFTASTAPAGSASLPFASTHVSNFISGIRLWDSNANMSLPPNKYWVVHGVSSAGTTGGASAATALTAATFACSALVSIGVNSNLASFGTSTQAFNHAYVNLGGSFTTNAINTTASLGITNISSWASNAVPYFFMERIST